MAARTLNVSEARRLLPSLVRDASRKGAVQIGARGRPEAVLLGMDDYLALRASAGRRPAVGKGSWDDLRFKLNGTIEETEAEIRSLRREFADRLPDGLTPPQACKQPRSAVKRR